MTTLRTLSSLALGVASFLLLGPLASVPGVILGRLPEIVFLICAGAGHIARPDSGGPSRKLISTTPPGLSRVASFRNARARAGGGICIHTALSRIRS